MNYIDQTFEFVLSLKKYSNTDILSLNNQCFLRNNEIEKLYDYYYGNDLLYISGNGCIRINLDLRNYEWI